MSLIEIRGAADLRVTQEELLVWFGYRNQAMDLLALQRALERAIKHKLEAGAVVEPGPHSARLVDHRLKIR